MIAGLLGFIEFLIQATVLRIMYIMLNIHTKKKSLSTASHTYIRPMRKVAQVVQLCALFFDFVTFQPDLLRYKRTLLFDENLQDLGFHLCIFDN